jgi:hypothetical protein
MLAEAIGRVTRLFVHGGTVEREDDLIGRVNRYRQAGSNVDGPHTLRGYQVDDLDYALMGADNSCARINHPDVDRWTREAGVWFAIDKRSDLARKSFGNSHGTSHDGGKTYITETALMGIPRPEYQASPEEVVWHHRRVAELKYRGVAQPERVHIMTAERADKPWLAA